MRALTFLVLTLALPAGCGRVEPPPATDSAQPSVSDRPMPSTASGDSLAPSYGRPHPGSWEPSSEYADSLFTFRYPSSARVEQRPPRDGAQEVLVSELPECRWPCYVTVRIRRDTTIAALDTAVREETTADTSDDPDAGDYAATVQDSLPLGNARAVHLETYCGDCTSGALLTAHGGWLARIEYTLDDRNGYNKPLLSHLVQVARTFRWRDDGPEHEQRGAMAGPAPEAQASWREVSRALRRSGEERSTR
jgi:hypothetical protein